MIYFYSVRIQKKLNFNNLKIRKIQTKINARQREKLDFENPVEFFYNLAA